MKAAVKKLIEKTANTRLFAVFRIAAWPYRHALGFHRNHDPRVSNCVNEVFPDLVVRNGPFKGMRYPRGQAFGSALLPKLLGSYESELDPVMRRILKNDYDQIIDIGSAEGYYAVGLALRFPKARVVAFDSSADANRLCTEMARLNGVGDRVQTAGFCGEKTLLVLGFSGRTLIVSDCEGYEMELFTPQVVSALRRHELIVEVHDYLNDRIGSTLRKRFKESHDLTVVESVDDSKKARTYRYSELESCDDTTRLLIVSEGRPCTMAWFHLAPRPDSSPRPPPVPSRSQPRHIPEPATGPASA